MSDTTFPLTKPIRAHGKELEELTLREPTTKDQMEIGQPFLIIVGDNETGIRIQQKTIGQWIVRLAGIPMSSVEQLDRQDFSGLQAVVLGFFGADVNGQVQS